MLTIHTAPLLLPVGGPPVVDGAVLVDGGRIAALGPHDGIAASAPGARLRRWPGLITPGLRQPHALRLLRGCYHPDPREAGELGELPLWGERLAALDLDLDESRWSGSIRRGLQRMLRHGTTALAAEGADPVVSRAMARSGLTVVPGAAEGPPNLDPLAGVKTLAAAVSVPLTVGGRADLAVFDATDESALLAKGATCCVATLIGGRLSYRSR